MAINTVDMGKKNKNKNRNNGFSSNGNNNNNSIFNDEAFNNDFKGFADAKPVEDFSNSKAYDPAGSGYGNASNNPGDPKKSKKIWNIIGIVLIILLLIGITRSISNKREMARGNNEVDLTAEQMEQLENILNEGNENNVVTSPEQVSSNTNTVNTVLADRSDGGREYANDSGYRVENFVQLAMIASDLEVEGIQRGCDVVYMMNKQIAPTPAPLNASLRALFNEEVQPDFEPGNFVATETDLEFINATIDNGIARVYLTGDYEVSEDECDANRPMIQIEETALQFSTVNSVEIYLDGEQL